MVSSNGGPLEYPHLVSPFYLGLHDHYRDGCLAVSDLSRSVGISEDSQASRDSFVKALCADFNRMLDAINVATGDSTCPECHAKVDSTFVIYSLRRLTYCLTLETFDASLK